MRKLLLIPFLVSSLNVCAQVNGQLTKQDAVDFIRKVYKDNIVAKKESYVTSEGHRLNNIDIQLDNCTLKIIISMSDVYANRVKESFRDTTFINLSLVKLIQMNKEFSQSYPDVYISSIGNGGIAHSKRVFYDEVIYYPKEDLASFDVSNIKLWNDYGLSNERLFMENGYPDRLFKAYEFLIKACGGGRLKINANDKF